MKNSLYFLQIHKNGNRVILDKVINKLSNSLYDIPITIGNKGWGPVKDDTFVITTFRHPVLRTVSHFCDYKKNILKDGSLPNIKEFAKWFDENQEALTNYQLKNLFYDFDTDGSLLNNENFKKLEFPKKMSDIKNRIRRIDAIVKIDNIRNETFISMNKNILDTFEREMRQPDISTIKYNINMFSRQLSLSLPEEVKKHIEYINDTEMNIYNTDSLFNKFLV